MYLFTITTPWITHRLKIQNTCKLELMLLLHASTSGCHISNPLRTFYMSGLYLCLDCCHAFCFIFVVVVFLCTAPEPEAKEWLLGFILLTKFSLKFECCVSHISVHACLIELDINLSDSSPDAYHRERSLPHGSKWLVKSRTKNTGDKYCYLHKNVRVTIRKLPS